MEYLKHWQFWVAVILVALVTNFVYSKYSGKGQLV